MANRIGLVSVSFRKNSPAEIVEAARSAKIECIEWGGDIHAPHGDIKRAEYIKELCQKNGIAVSQYGSYYKIGQSHPSLWGDVVSSARALGTKVIRVWPGQNIVVKDLSPEQCQAMVEDGRRICDEAPDFTVALECHGSSLTEHYEIALKFLGDVGRENMKMFWQPNQARSFEYDLDAIEALLPYMVSVHTFYWDKDGTRYPLSYGGARWGEYIKRLSKKELTYMLEFVRNDDISLLGAEADTLRALLSR